MCMLCRFRTLGGRACDKGEPGASPQPSCKTVSFYVAIVATVAILYITYVEVGHVRRAGFALVVDAIVC